MDSALKSMNLEKVIELTMYMYLYLHVHVHDMHVARSFSTNIHHCTMLLMFSNNYSHSPWTCIIFPNLCNTVHVVTLDTASIVAIVLQIHVLVHACMYMYMYMYMILIIMWYQKVCNCRQYCFNLVRSHLRYSIHTFGTTGLYTRDYSEQLWFLLNEIHQPQLLRVNQGKPQLQIKQLMGRAGVMKPPKAPKPIVSCW